jgi:hypothetical protein
VLVNSSVCAPPIIKNLATGQEHRLPSVGSRSDSADEPISAAIFDRRGAYIIAGSTKVNYLIFTYFSNFILRAK